jgi:hypothetical protein
MLRTLWFTLNLLVIFVGCAIAQSKVKQSLPLPILPRQLASDIEQSKLRSLH